LNASGRVELLAREHVHPRLAVAFARERDAAVVHRRAAVRAGDGAPVDRASSALVADLLDLLDVDRLAAEQHHPVRLLQVEVALGLLDDAAARIAPHGDRRAADVVVHVLDRARDVDPAHELVEGDREDVLAGEDDRAVDVAPAHAVAVRGDVLEQPFVRRQRRGDPFVVGARECRRVDQQRRDAAAQPVLREHRVLRLRQASRRASSMFSATASQNERGFSSTRRSSGATTALTLSL
jgi:hypothetical protein